MQAFAKGNDKGPFRTCATTTDKAPKQAAAFHTPSFLLIAHIDAQREGEELAVTVEESAVLKIRRCGGLPAIMQLYCQDRGSLEVFAHSASGEDRSVVFLLDLKIQEHVSLA